MAAPLLETKLYVPRRRRGVVPRPRLSARLDRGAEGKLTLVSAAWWSSACLCAAVHDLVTALILDVDGTLVESNEAHARAWVDVLTEDGFSVSVPQVQRLIGMGSDKLLPAAIGLDKDTPLGAQLTERRKEVFESRYLGSLKPTRGARALLDRLRADGIDLVVASAAEGEELAALLAVCGAEDLADRTPPDEEVDGSKPDPDIVEAALRKLGRPAPRVRMLGGHAVRPRSGTAGGCRHAGGAQRRLVRRRPARQRGDLRRPRRPARALPGGRILGNLTLEAPGACANVHALALRTKQAEQLDALRAGAIEPVRDARLEFGDLAGVQDQVVLAEHQA